MPVERSIWAELVVDVFIAYAHLDVGEVVMDLGIDVVVDMSFGLVEVIEGDPAVEGVIEWNIELEGAFVIC